MLDLEFLRRQRLPYGTFYMFSPRCMSSVHETAYPRFKPNLTDQELNEIYTPSQEELKFIHAHGHSPTEKLSLLVLIKTGQRLGYFIPPSDVPTNIIVYIATCSDLKNIDSGRLRELEKTGVRHRLRDLARSYFNLKTFDEDCQALISHIAEEAAETKQELADIINVVIEELVRLRIELPGFSTLQRSARNSRSAANHRLYDSIYNSLSSELKTELSDFLKVSAGNTLSKWNKLKKEPKKPTNREARSYLAHLSWLKEWVDLLPDVSHIPFGRWRQLVLESRALDVSDLKRIKLEKRYTLIVVLSYSQLRSAMDDAVTILTRKLKSLHNRADQRLKQYHLEHTKKIETLISQFRDVLHAYREGETDSERISRISASLRSDPEHLVTECDEHMAYSGNSYIPFMLGSYRSQRPLLLNYLDLLNIQSSSNDTLIIEAIQFLLRNRNSRKPMLSIENEKLNLKWLPDKWKKLVTGKASGSTSVKVVDRLYFELCVLTQVITELKTGDLFIEDSENHNDYRNQLISWSQYEREVVQYSQLVGLPISPKEFVHKIRKELSEIAIKIDNQFPKNELVDINKDGLMIHKSEKAEELSILRELDEAITQRMPENSILDLLVETEDWLKLHTQFGPISGFESKVENRRQRLITTLFCYGCNLGPQQTIPLRQGFQSEANSMVKLTTDH